LTKLQNSLHVTTCWVARPIFIGTFSQGFNLRISPPVAY